MPQSLMSLQTDIVRRYFTESCKIFTANATIIDVYTDGDSPSTFVVVVHNYRQTHQWIVRIPKGGY